MTLDPNKVKVLTQSRADRTDTSMRPASNDSATTQSYERYERCASVYITSTSALYMKLICAKLHFLYPSFLQKTQREWRKLRGFARLLRHFRGEALLRS